MELIKVNKKELEIIRKSATRKPRKLQRLIEEFVCSGENAAKIIYNEDEYKNLNSMYASMWMACRRSRHRVHSELHMGDVYLIRDED